MNKEKQEEDVLNKLRLIVEPNLKQNIVELGFIDNLLIEGSRVQFDLLGEADASENQKILGQLATSAIKELDWVSDVSLRLVTKEPEGLKSRSGLDAVKYIVAVSSCKGGVGKSTVAIKLACSLVHLGLRVGVFDADLYGPSLPSLLYLASPEPKMAGEMLFPLQKYGLKLMSFGYVQEANDDTGPAIMRGSMATQVTQQLLTGTQWGELDVLVLDLPPGTGDIPLTISQNIPVTASVMVTTPQKLSFVDVIKGIEMFDTLAIPTAAVVENMAFFEEPKTKEKHYLFGRGAARKLKEEYGFSVSCELPLEPKMSEVCDDGIPFVVEYPDHPLTKRLHQFSDRLLNELDRFARKQDEHPDITMDEPSLLTIQHNKKTSMFKAYDLRLQCRCAHCIDERTGEKRLNEDNVPNDISIVAYKRVGNYALGLSFSDGHQSLLPFSALL